MPGLFQNRDYAAAVARAFVPSFPKEITRSGVETRIQRQSRLVDQNPLRVEAIITEAVLHLEVGGPEVMRRQRAGGCWSSPRCRTSSCG